VKLASDEAIERLTYAQKLSRSSAAGRMQAFSGPGERALILAGWNQVHAVGLGVGVCGWTKPSTSWSLHVYRTCLLLSLLLLWSLSLLLSFLVNVD
jgi:hypothetical protein